MNPGAGQVRAGAHSGKRAEEGAGAQKERGKRARWAALGQGSQGRGQAGLCQGCGNRWVPGRAACGRGGHGSLCALLLSTGFGSFIAGRPFPALCQLFLREPGSASLPAFAMGHVPLPVTWGVKQSSCEKGREGGLGAEAGCCSHPIPLLCSPFPGWMQLGMFAKLKNSWSSLVVIPVSSICGHPALASAFLPSLSTRGTGTGMALLLGLCVNPSGASVTRFPKV